MWYSIEDRLIGGRGLACCIHRAEHAAESATGHLGQKKGEIEDFLQIVFGTCCWHRLRRSVCAVGTADDPIVFAGERAMQPARVDTNDDDDEQVERQQQMYGLRYAYYLLGRAAVQVVNVQDDPVNRVATWTLVVYVPLKSLSNSTSCSRSLSGLADIRPEIANIGLAAWVRPARKA